MNKKILIVEDEFVVANALRLILVQAGYKVTGIAASTDEADSCLRQEKADLVLLDIRLNGKQTGIDLARRLQNHNIPFIYLSANSSQKTLEEAKLTEPYGFLVKPFREKDLLVTLDIAWYRFKHSLETRIRQEEMLLDQLKAICIANTAPEQKLLRVSKAIQSFIPFDLIISVASPAAGLTISTGYLRTGFDEYQSIAENDLMAITCLKENMLSMIIGDSSSTAEAHILTDGDTREFARVGRPHRFLFDYFKIESFLTTTVNAVNGVPIHYFFYSRQRRFYTPCHVTLLDRIKDHLSNIDLQDTEPEKVLVWTETSPAPTDRRSMAVANGESFKYIIGDHPLLLSALDLTAQVAPYSTSVLILGESGTGKEKVAQAIHSLSARKDYPFVKINCAAIPASLIESELFGHEKGAFTGAVEKRIGKFEQADGGTIFLDEIGELHLDMQIKLLRVLQEKEIEYVGGRQTKKVDVRIVAATNRNLEKEVAEGHFRLDLYYRLNVFPIILPPLRDRKSDIPALAHYFGTKFCKAFNKEFRGIATAMLEEMYTYNWPGNIRELENILERSVILNDGSCQLELKRSLKVIAAEMTGGKPAANPETLVQLRQIQQETERDYIISTLRKTKGRVRGKDGAAELLNLKPTTLDSRILKLGIKREDYTDP